MSIQKIITKGKVPVKIYTDEIEAEAMQQLYHLSELPFIHSHIAAMPDVHFGKGATQITIGVNPDQPVSCCIDNSRHAETLNGHFEQGVLERSFRVDQWNSVTSVHDVADTKQQTSPKLTAWM